MGADKPDWEKLPPKTQTPISLLFIGAAASLVMVALVFRLAFPEKIPMPILTPQEQAKLEKRLKEIDDSEQYALLAKVNGWYPCLHRGRAQCYLLAGEVWKYGVTSKGQFGRYSAEFLIGNKVSYFIQFKGNFAECLKQEQIRLFNYRYLPENLGRPPAERLPRPPYNPILR